MDVRRRYPINVTINERKIIEVVIDPHYEIKHSDSVNDEVILNLVNLLNGGTYEPISERDGFQYFVADPITLNEVDYRLVWLLEDKKLFVGVVNAFRR